MISPPWPNSRSAGRPENHSHEIKEQGRQGAAFAADIADEYEVADLFHAVDDRFGAWTWSSIPPGSTGRPR